MAANVFRDDNQVKIGGWLNFSDSTNVYFECQITDPIWTQHNEDVLKNTYIQQNTEYDSDGNAITLPDIVSVSAEEPTN